jgi:hypothetical protein
MTGNRNSGAGRLRRGNVFDTEDVNPAESMTNLADVMLVLVVGLLLSLITFWNVDIAGASGSAVSVEQGQEITDPAGLSSDSPETMEEDTQYEEYGTVYRDTATGKLYMVTEGS